MSTWDSILGQAAVIDVFRRAVQSRRLGSTFLFVGPAGVGHLERPVLLGQEGQRGGDLMNAGVVLFFDGGDHVEEEAEILGFQDFGHLLAEGCHPLVGHGLAAGQLEGLDGLLGGALDLAQ